MSYTKYKTRKGSLACFLCGVIIVLLWSSLVFGIEKVCVIDTIPDDSLPNPILDGHPEWVSLYWKAWHIAKTKIQYGTPQNGFVDRYMDEGFNPNIFQWDSCFMMMFARYGFNIFPSIVTLDNFYRKQHADGFICREIRESDGSDYWSKTSPIATNPPLFAWAEWEHFKITCDTARLDTVVQHLKDYYQWCKLHRTRINELYWWSTLGSGMDNSPRWDAYTWIDYSAQQALAALYISKIGKVIGHYPTYREYEDEYLNLKLLINDKMWDAEDGLYYDLTSTGSFLKVKTAASFWPMLTGICDSAQAARLVTHLTDTLEFWRLHVFPTLAADHPNYEPRGGYWCGSVWAPTNYTIIKGLQNCGYEDLAMQAAQNHIENMSQVYINITPHTIWENYAPDYAIPGSQSRGDFVGWSGCGPIALLIENVLGFRIDGLADSLLWRLRLTEKHGIERLRFGDNKVDIIADERSWHTDSFDIHVTTNSPFTLVVDAGKGIFKMEVPEGTSHYKVVGVPRIQIIKPEDGDAFKKNSVHIKGLCTPSIESIEIAINGEVIGNATIVDTEWCYDWQAHEIGKYRVTATGIDADGNRYSSQISVLVLGMEQGILLVDETRNGTGAPGSPNDDQVDKFYHNILTGYSLTDWDVDSLGLPGLLDLGCYSLIIWHGDDYANQQIYSAISDLSKYLNAGGKLWLVGWRPMQALTRVGVRPLLFEEGDFPHDYLGLSWSNESKQCDFMGAMGLLGYPDILVDSNKVPSSWAGKLKYVDVFEPYDAEPIYVFNSYSADTTFQGRPCAVRRSADNYTVVFFGFPLYFMKEEKAKDVAQKVLAEFGIVGVEEEMASSEAPQIRLFQNYPNPFNQSTVIRLEFPISNFQLPITLAIYDLSGRLVRTLIDESSTCHQSPITITWNRTDNSGNKVSSGIYFCKLKIGKFVDTKKLIIISE